MFPGITTSEATLGEWISLVFFFRFEQCGIQIVLIEIGMLYIAVILIENPASSQSDIVVNPAINEYAYATIW